MVNRDDDFEGRWPILPDLIDAETLAKQPKVFLTAERILELAAAGFMPCWRVDGGRFLFRLPDVRRWVRAHLSQEQPGMPYPAKISVLSPAPRGLPFEKLPSELMPMYRHLNILNDTWYPPCIYFLIHKKKVVYVGQSIQLINRIATHRSSNKIFDTVLYLPVPESDLTSVEQAFIRVLRPELNGEISESGDRYPVRPRDRKIVEEYCAPATEPAP